MYNDFIGIDLTYPTATGELRRRCYLDSAASTLMMGAAHRQGTAYLAHYGNIHSQIHHGARITAYGYEAAHQQVLSFFNADPKIYACVFAGQGTTSLLNRLARQLSLWRPERGNVLISQMEHHSNDLPHRQHAKQYTHLAATERLSVEALTPYVLTAGQQLNYLAITASSNVTGVINPIKEIAQLLRTVDAKLVVDLAQYVAHVPLDLSDLSLDCLVFSGHKIYVPGAPGVMVIKRELLAQLPEVEFGGGTVKDVWLDTVDWHADQVSRQEAGTPNLPGAIMLAKSLQTLQTLGMEKIHAYESQLLLRLEQALLKHPQVRLYGVKGLLPTERTPILAFNIEGLDHGLVGAILNDYFNIAVRNACFCAHPYVRTLLKSELLALHLDPDHPQQKQSIELKKGMVRASLGLYSTEADVDLLVDAVGQIIERADFFKTQYLVDAHLNYRHRTFCPDLQTLFQL